MTKWIKILSTVFFRLSFANDGCLIPIACMRFNLFHIQVYYFMPSSRVLVCTPSNSAADLICIRLHNSGFLHAASMARVNASCRQNEVFNIVFRLMCLTISDLDFYFFIFFLSTPPRSLSQKCWECTPGQERTFVKLLSTGLWSAPAPVLACSII